jgi:hypothetical protein
MTEHEKTMLEYIGPSNASWFDGDKDVTLVAGRRYQIPTALAEYWLVQSAGHWKRPDPPTAAIATKE